MDPETSPFRPGQPAPVEFFVGRSREVERLRGMVKAGRTAHRTGYGSGNGTTRRR